MRFHLRTGFVHSSLRSGRLTVLSVSCGMIEFKMLLKNTFSDAYRIWTNRMYLF